MDVHPPANAVVGFQETVGIRIWDGARYATANLVLLAPDRAPAGGVQPTPAQLAQNMRAYDMRNVTNLFPVGLTLDNYNAMAPNIQAQWNQSLAPSIHQGFASGDSAVASTLAARIRQNGFTWLNNTITGTYNAGGQLTAASVKFEQRAANDFITVNVGVPTQAQRAEFGYSGGQWSGLSLWYTIYEMAYAARYRRPQDGPYTSTTIGTYFQPVATGVNSALVIRRVAGGPGGMAGSNFDLANSQQAYIVTLLENATRVMAATTLTTFTAQQQTRATADTIDPATCYAVIGYNDNNGNPVVTLMSPRDGTQKVISRDDFWLLFGSLITV